MERKRKLPTRASRASENASKKRMTPPDQRTQTPTPAESPAPPIQTAEPLPRKIEPGKPLPTLEDAQENLLSSEWQSVSESGVLQESLRRSRQQWISEGIFERYWMKPTKKKGAEIPIDNPGKDTMSRIGNVQLFVEPHVFDTVMFTIKDTTPRPPMPQTQQPFLQYGPPGGSFPQQIAAVQPPVQRKNTEDIHMTNSGPPPTPSNAPHTNEPLSNGHLNPNLPPKLSQPIPSIPPNPPAHPAPAPAGRGTDPVIQMLAERAATDPELKALMRIVANGEASQMQLKHFQNHIDELTRLQKARQAAAQASQQQPPASHPSAAPASPAIVQPVPQVNGKAAPRPVQAPMAVAVTPAKAVPVPPAVKAEYQQPQALRSKGPLPSKSDISGVVFEFAGGNGDRYLFPKFSILEFIPGNQVVASFLIVRKGSSSDSPSYDPDLDYYQPITIRLQAQERQLQALSKVVAPQEEVQRYMNDIMDKATRAEYVLLAMRLPKDKEGTQNPDKDEEEKEKAEETPIVGWATTNSTTNSIIKAKPVKKIPSEEEQYQSFIKTVAAPV